MKAGFLTTLLFVFYFGASAQTDSTFADTLSVVSDTPEEIVVASQSGNGLDTTLRRSPRKALLLSFALPGAGQVYNKKYWKVPIIYGGFGVSLYFLRDNLQNIEYYKEQWRYQNDDDPSTVNETDLNSTQLIETTEIYKRWRDLSYLSIGLIYILNAVDAYVDAHLFYFDVNDDISLNLRPNFQYTAGPSTGISLCLNF